MSKAWPNRADFLKEQPFSSIRTVSSLKNAERAKAWRLAHPEHKERYKEYQKSWELLHKDSRAYKAKARRLWTKYKITPEEWQAMYDRQNGRCAICNKHQSELKRSLQTDHNHTTNKVRGLLCAPCNKGIGMFYDNPNYLDNASKYVKGLV